MKKVSMTSIIPQTPIIILGVTQAVWLSKFTHFKNLPTVEVFMAVHNANIIVWVLELCHLLNSWPDILATTVVTILSRDIMVFCSWMMIVALCWRLYIIAVIRCCSRIPISYPLHYAWWYDCSKKDLRYISTSLTSVEQKEAWDWWRLGSGFQ